MAVSTFLDTSVLLAGIIDFGPQSAPAQRILHAIAEKTLTGAATAWHCCLEFYAVCTRLPVEYRLPPADAVRLMSDEILGRLAIHDLPAADRAVLLRDAAHEGVTGGRIYDAHIAEIARAAGATIIVTDNRRHFVSTLKHGIRVETPADFASMLRVKK